jgi:anaphase-promoting complex subunit 2
MHPTIISRHFWPALESSGIVMPGQFEKCVLCQLSLFIGNCAHLSYRLQAQYAKEFSTFKPDKKLRWLPHLGTVHLELQLEDRKIMADVGPLEAAFIELFSEKSKALATISLFL